MTDWHDKSRILTLKLYSLFQKKKPLPLENENAKKRDFPVMGRIKNLESFVSLNSQKTYDY